MKMLPLNRYTGHFFALPALALIGIIAVFPICYNLYLSLNTWFVASPKGPAWVGLANYVDLISDPRFWNSLRVTLLFTIGALGAQVFLGVLLALFFNRTFRGRAVVKTIFLLPIAATPVAVSLIWAMMYNYDLGVINVILRHLGLPPPLWLASPETVIPALIITDTWQWTPLVMLIVLASLESLPQDPFESARIDGANGLQIVFHITLPLVKPAIVVAAMLRSIDAIKTFDLIYVMTQGGPDIASENLNVYVFHKGFFYFKMGMASSMAVVLFTIVLVVNILLAIFRKGEQAYV